MTIVLKSGSLNFLELSGPVQACNGIAFFTFNFTCKIILLVMSTTKEWSRIYSFCHAQTLAAVHSVTRQAMYVYRNIEAPSINNCCRGKAINSTYFEYLSLALVIQHAKGMGRIMSLVVPLAAPYFSTLSHKRHDFWGKK